MSTLPRSTLRSGVKEQTIHSKLSTNWEAWSKTSKKDPAGILWSPSQPSAYHVMGITDKHRRVILRSRVHFLKSAIKSFRIWIFYELKTLLVSTIQELKCIPWSFKTKRSLNLWDERVNVLDAGGLTKLPALSKLHHHDPSKSPYQQKTAKSWCLIPPESQPSLQVFSCEGCCGCISLKL